MRKQFSIFFLCVILTVLVSSTLNYLSNYRSSKPIFAKSSSVLAKIDSKPKEEESIKPIETDQETTTPIEPKPSEEKELRPSDECAKIPFAFSKNICPKIVSFDFEYLLMNFFEDGLEYTTIINDESIKTKNKQKFKSGARFSAEFKAYRSVYLDLAYTYIRMNNKDSISAGADTILGTFLPPNFSSLNSASAKLTGNFNTWDLFLVKPYFVSECFISRPILGIRGAIIDQSIKIFYDIADSTNPVNAKNKYWGVGLNAGYRSEFLITKNYIIDTKSLFSLLYGKSKLSQNSSSPITPHATYDVKEDITQVKPNVELGIGFSYNRYFTKNINRLSFRVGYEFQHWWDQNQLKRFFSVDPVAIKTVSRNSLKFNGFTFSLNIEI